MRIDIGKIHEHVFKQAAVARYFTPGRVNLIGEHLDYNGGYVFPCALEMGTYGAFSWRDDQEVHLFSDNFSGLGIKSFSLGDIHYDGADDWANYPKGIFALLQKMGRPIHRGMNISYLGNLPNGAGLSSSASIEVLSGLLINEACGLGLSYLDIVKLSQQVENDFIGVQSGIMDQFAVAMGKRDHAILLNSATLDYQYVPFVLRDTKIVITNTNKRRGLGDTAYNQRRAECQQALQDLRKVRDLRDLCSLTPPEFETLAMNIKDPVARRRAHHVVYENQRVLDSVAVLKKNDLETFGQLMNQSHCSLRDEYQVSCWELDCLVSTACELPETIGSRMTGAGFGGCTVSLVRTSGLDHFIETVGTEYHSRAGYTADFYVTEVGDGGRQLDDSIQSI